MGLRRYKEEERDKKKEGKQAGKDEDGVQESCGRWIIKLISDWYSYRSKA